MSKKCLTKYNILILLIISINLLSCNSGSGGNYSGNSTVGSNIGLNSNSKSSLNSSNRSTLINATQLGTTQSLILADRNGFVYDESMVLGGGIQPFPNNAKVSSMVTGSDGNIYAGTIFESAASVYELSSGAWQALPSLPNPNPQYTIESISIAVDNGGNIYAGITNGGYNSSHVYELPFSSTSWLELGTYVPYSDRAVTIAVDSNNNVYADTVSYANKTFVSQFDSASNSWKTSGGGAVPSSSGGASTITIDENNNVYVGTTSNRHVAYLYELESNTWNELGGGPAPISSVSSISIATDGTNVYASTVSNDNMVYVHKLNSNSSSWGKPIGEGIVYNGATSKISINNGNVYLAIQSSGSSASAYIYELISNEWQKLGSTSVPNNGNNPSGIPVITVDKNGNVYSSIGNNYVYELWYNTTMWIASSGHVPKSNTGQTVIVTDNNGNVYAVANNHNESGFNTYVYKLESNSWQNLNFANVANINYISSMVTDNNGNVYVSGGVESDGNSYVYEFESGVWSKLVPAVPYGYGGIYEISIDKNNNLYASLYSSYVYELSNGTVWNELGGGIIPGNGISSITVDLNGIVYVSSTSKIHGKYYSSLYYGSESTNWQQLGNAYPGINSTLARDSSGNVYASTSNLRSIASNNVYELKFETTTWQQLGGTIPGGIQDGLPGMVVSNSGTVYVASHNGNVYTLESGAWQNTNYGAMNGSPIVALALRPRQ